MTTNKVMWLLFVIVLALCVVGLVVLFTRPPVQPPIEKRFDVNGQTLTLDNADTMTIESRRDVTDYGDVVETTTITTVTVWMKVDKP